MEEMDRARTELKQSKALLMNSEKMALVGKLATEVAHSIRNPMTSINMRLFSLKRNLEMSDVQKEDFEVVADEMRRLDNIVRNFLEFSRPHKLKKQKVNISDVIDMTIDLVVLPAGPAFRDSASETGQGSAAHRRRPGAS